MTLTEKVRTSENPWLPRSPLMVLSKALSTLCLLAVPFLVQAKPTHQFAAGAKTKFFASSVTAANLTYVENSGICETTPGVQQISGYVTVGTNMNMVGLLNSKCVLRMCVDCFFCSGSGSLLRGTHPRPLRLRFGEFLRC